MFSRFRSWVAQHPALTHAVVAVLFGVVGVLAAVFAYVMERVASAQGHHLDFLSVAIFAVLVPTAFAALFTVEVATAWLTERWANEGREQIFVETFKTPLEMAQRRLDVVNAIASGELTHDVYCTSHCNLFYDTGMLGPQGEKLDLINRKFFRQLVKLTVSSTPGLMLLLHYSDDDAFSEEMGPRLDIYLEVCEGAGNSPSLESFNPCRLIHESMKDYFVVENHVFKTIRKTKHSEGPTEYMHIQSDKIAAQYRAWLADMFAHGDGFDNPTMFVEKDDFKRKYDEFRKAVERERRAHRSGV